jgi:membrane protein YqaA with SNARE-associated domain
MTNMTNVADTTNQKHTSKSAFLWFLLSGAAGVGLIELAFVCFGVVRLDFWRFVAGIAALCFARHLMWDTLDLWLEFLKARRAEK